MSLVIYGHYMSIGKALVTFSALEAGGFHPSFHNYHHAYMDYLKMLTLGGLIVLIPKNEIDGANEWISHLHNNAHLDDEPMLIRKYGMWKRATALIFLCTGLLLPLFLFPIILFVSALFGAIIFVSPSAPFGFYPIFALSIFFSFMILHIHFIALPKLKNNKKDKT